MSGTVRQASLFREAVEEVREAALCRAPDVRLELPFPPSVNRYWRHVGMGGGVRVLLSREGRRYKAAVKAVVWATVKATVRARVGTGEPLTGRLAVDVRLYPPDRLRRDIDNFGGKALLDALTEAGVWRDDSQLDELRIRRCAVCPGGRCVVDIRRLDGATATRNGGAHGPSGQ